MRIPELGESIRKLLCGLLGLGCVFGASGAQNPHYVFAHYMVCFATYGQTIDGYKREIQEAQAAGLDGFALNMGAWNNTDTYYQTNTALMYAAAEQLGTGFKLFFSVDFYDGTNSDAVGMVLSYAQRTNTFRQNGKVVLSTYDGNGMGWPAIRSQIATNGVDTFFIPYLLSIPVHELPGYADALSILSTNRWANAVDGLFLWAAAGLPDQLVQCNACYREACREQGYPFMASCSPHYWGNGQISLGRRYFESQGGEGTVLQWMSIINTQPDWVEICTWNDFQESTYISPVDDPGKYSSSLTSPRRYCHSGYLELAKHFINWYKTGSEPPTERDALYYFYRTHPKDAVASNTNDVPVTTRIGDVEDLIYSTVFLIAPAQLEIQSGPTSTTNLLGAGMTHLRTPFAPGSQNMVLKRSGNVVLSLQGPDILSSIQVYDFFPASGFAYGSVVKPPAPSNFRVVSPLPPQNDTNSGTPPAAVVTNLLTVGMTPERWLAAFTNVFADVQATTPVTSGGRVRRWNDSSGNGNDVIAPGQQAPPLTGSALAGQPAIGSFGETTLYFTNLNRETTYASPQTFVLVLQPALTDQYFFDSGDYSTGTNELYFMQQNGSLFMGCGNGGPDRWPPAGTNAVWYCLTYNGLLSSIICNGVMVGFGISFAPTPINGLTIGRRGDNNGGFLYIGYMAEFAQYSGVPTPNDIMVISNYCSARYGIHN